mmetsp:Transcript_94477/g.148708  ORF Transcript_94477/g.148708 Transcript_94477/m.148708 type:complete len:264 (+) Transcript_94477:71-862(+)
MNNAPQQVGASANVMANPGEDPFQGCTSVTCYQEIALVESICGIEAPNRYRICNTQTNQQIMYCHENSECCERICCAPCRTLTMNARPNADKSSGVILSMQKPYHCPMIPCAVVPLSVGFTLPCVIGAFMSPATVTVRDGPDTSPNILGTVFDPPGPAFWCNIDLVLRDKNGTDIFTCGPKTLCSCGQLCPCCYGEYIPVKDMSGKEVGHINRPALTFEECCCKINRFEVNFGSVTDPVHKKLIFAAGFLLDLQYWEQQKKNN